MLQMYFFCGPDYEILLNQTLRILLSNRANINFLKMILLHQVTELSVLYLGQSISWKHAHTHTHTKAPNFLYRVLF